MPSMEETMHFCFLTLCHISALYVIDCLNTLENYQLHTTISKNVILPSHHSYINLRDMSFIWPLETKNVLIKKQISDLRAKTDF